MSEVPLPESNERTRSQACEGRTAPSLAPKLASLQLYLEIATIACEATGLPSHLRSKVSFVTFPVGGVLSSPPAL